MATRTIDERVRLLRTARIVRRVLWVIVGLQWVIASVLAVVGAAGPAVFLLLVVSGFVFFDGLYIGPQTRNVADAIERDRQAGSASDAAFPEGRDA
jgi:uncharacterized membrane protein